MRINDKADYVRAHLRDDPGSHHCHWPGCGKRTPAAVWGCVKHWKMLPREIQRRIWNSFRPGQEETKTPSRAYVEAAREAQEWIAKNYPPTPTLL